MPTWTTSVMTWTTALVRTTYGICNGREKICECGCSDIPAGDCDCDGTNSTPWACAVTALKTPMDGICDDVDDCVGARRLRHLQRPGEISADVLTSLLVTATATVTNSTPWACVVVTALRTPMLMAATTWTTALVTRRLWHLQRSGRYCECGCSDIPAMTATAPATNSTPWACVDCAADADGWHL